MADVQKAFARQVQWMDERSGYNTTQQSEQPVPAREICDQKGQYPAKQSAEVKHADFWEGESTELATQSDENRPKQKQILSSEGSTQLDPSIFLHSCSQGKTANSSRLYASRL